MQVDTIRTKKDYYVKLENFIVEDIALLSYKRIQASSGPELLKEVIAYYGFNPSYYSSLQLWSSPNRTTSATIRLDQLAEIPEEVEFVWARGYSA
jgi:hypothetical protein